LPKLRGQELLLIRAYCTPATLRSVKQVKKMEKGADAGNGSSTESLKVDRVEELRKDLKATRRYEEAEYLLADPKYRDVLCFEGAKPKNLVYMRLDQVVRRLKPEWVVYRLVELGLFDEVIVDSYPTKECRKECVERRGRKCVEYVEVCEDVTKNIEGIMPSEELLKVCRNKRYSSP
jgi:hypothetical protein